MGATKVIDPRTESIKDAMKSLGMVGGFDIGLECSGSSAAFGDMVENMYNGGKISLLGLLPSSTQINWSKLIFKGLTMKGIYGREMYETLVPDGNDAFARIRYCPSDNSPVSSR